MMKRRILFIFKSMYTIFLDFEKLVFLIKAT
jgi:hypothetical protein